jgi:hypothetical protein
MNSKKNIPPGPKKTGPKTLAYSVGSFLEYGITDLHNSQGALMANKSQVYTTLRA